MNMQEFQQAIWRDLNERGAAARAEYIASLVETHVAGAHQVEAVTALNALVPSGAVTTLGAAHIYAKLRDFVQRDCAYLPDSDSDSDSSVSDSDDERPPSVAEHPTQAQRAAALPSNDANELTADAQCPSLAAEEPRQEEKRPTLSEREEAERATLPSEEPYEKEQCARMETGAYSGKRKLGANDDADKQNEKKQRKWMCELRVLKPEDIHWRKRGYGHWDITVLHRGQCWYFKTQKEVKAFDAQLAGPDDSAEKDPEELKMLKAALEDFSNSSRVSSLAQKLLDMGINRDVLTSLRKMLRSTAETPEARQYALKLLERAVSKCGMNDGDAARFVFAL